MAKQVVVSEKLQNLRRLEAQRNELNAKGQSCARRGVEREREREREYVSLLRPWHHSCRVRVCTVRMLREELQMLQEPGSYVGEVAKSMGKTKVLVKVRSWTW